LENLRFLIKSFLNMFVRFVINLEKLDNLYFTEIEEIDKQKLLMPLDTDT